MKEGPITQEKERRSRTIHWWIIALIVLALVAWWIIGPPRAH